MRAGRAVTAALRDDDEVVRQHAAASLGPFTADAAVSEALVAAPLHDTDLDVRHNALTAVEQAGSDPRFAEPLPRLTSDPDPDLGRAAVRALDLGSAPPS